MLVKANNILKFDSRTLAINISDVRLAYWIASKEVLANQSFIFQVSERSYKSEGHFLIRTLQDLAKRSKAHIALYLDHCTDIELCKKAIVDGVSGVLFDGSQLSIKQNIEKTIEIKKIAERYDVILEAEVNGIPGVEDGIEKRSVKPCDLEILLDFIEKTKVDLIAPYFGNKHGIYENEDLSFDLDYLKSVRKSSPVPLVIHGGSGMPESVIRELNTIGFAKINYSTDFKNMLCDTKGSIEPFKMNYEIEKTVIEHVVALLDKHKK